ncbi:MAG: hypothetical protein ABI882_23460, partial [Acidobacteriota bacterium]
SCQLSVVSCQLSVASCQLPVAKATCQRAGDDLQIALANRQQTIATLRNGQLTTDQLTTGN